MKLAIYKTNYPSSEYRQFRFAVSNDEHERLNLDGGFNVRIDGSVVYLERKEEGNRFSRKTGSAWALQAVVKSDEPPFASTTIHEDDVLGDANNEIVAMVDLNKLNRIAPTTYQSIKHKHKSRLPANSPQHNNTVAGAIVPNAKILRMVHELLGDYFDENRHYYRQGYSDERIAREASCSVDFVKRQREEAYGHISPPVNVQALVASITQFKKIRDDLSCKLTEIDQAIRTLQIFLDQTKRTGT